LPDDPVIARCFEVSKTYRTRRSEVRALRDVSATFPASSLSVVAGPSGSGKSSLLRLLAGMDRPTSGGIRVADVDVSRARPGALRRLRRGFLGYLFQRPADNFLPHLTVEQHLLGAARRGRRHHPAVSWDALIDTLGLHDRLDHLPGELSGGEQQRAAIAQIVLAGARFIVVDEPTSQLDSASAADVVSVLASLRKAGLTFVVATHDEAVMSAADELIRLDHGERVTGRQQILRLASLPPRPDPRESGGPPLLQVEGLRKSFGRGPEAVHAVRDSRFEIGGTETVALVGRSGSGKTTLLNLVAGWERPDAGSVSMAGVLDPHAASWVDLAVLPQRLGLMEELSVRENIEYPARLSGRLEELETVILDLIDALGLRQLIDRYPAEISVGEQQRTALARALVLAPRLLVADEPSSHQDRGWTVEVLALIDRASRQGTACLAATHDEAIVRSFDRVLSMEDGAVRERSA
jgi:ABC-type lipoprotein export system ATPase subunit